MKAYLKDNFFIHLTLLGVILCQVGCQKVKYEPNWSSLDARPLPQWYDKAKVGIFLHWGVYSVPSYDTEWFQQHIEIAKSKKALDFMAKNYPPGFTYADFAPMFTAEFFDPNQWAELFKKSGAKYVVLTTKHCEGYTLWPSKYSHNWNAMDVGPKRDLVGDLSKAVRAHNLTMGLYYSLLEWVHPLYVADKANHWATNDFVRTKVRPEMEELINLYKPSLLWTDGNYESPDTYWNSTHFLSWLYNDSPVKNEIVVNDRWGNETECKHGGYLNCHDIFFPKKLLARKWENAMRIEKRSWGYSRTATLAEYYSIDDLLHMLIQTIAYGGNILINIGPTKEGRIIPIFEERLTQLGEWLSVNGEAIYESKTWQHQHDSVNKDLYYTERDGHVYGLLTTYPANDLVEFGDIPHASVKSIQLLGYIGAVTSAKGSKDHLVVNFPHITPLMKPKHSYVFKVELLK